MLILAISILLAMTAFAVALALVDCWISGKFMMESLREERALLDAGFVPVAAGGEPRLRTPVGFQALAARPALRVKRLPAQRPVTDHSRAQRSQPGAA